MDTCLIPKHLSDPPRWLFWTLDEAAILVTSLVGGILCNHTFFTLVIGILSMCLLKKVKGARGEGFLLAALYWYFPLSTRFFKATPPSYIREYIG